MIYGILHLDKSEFVEPDNDVYSMGCGIFSLCVVSK